MCVCARARARVCVCVCVRACVRACVLAFECLFSTSPVLCVGFTTLPYLNIGTLTSGDGAGQVPLPGLSSPVGDGVLGAT